jgi:hypothetical protein
MAAAAVAVELADGHLLVADAVPEVAEAEAAVAGLAGGDAVDEVDQLAEYRSGETTPLRDLRGG